MWLGWWWLGWWYIHRIWASWGCWAGLRLLQQCQLGKLDSRLVGCHVLSLATTMCATDSSSCGDCAAASGCSRGCCCIRLFRVVAATAMGVMSRGVRKVKG